MNKYENVMVNVMIKMHFSLPIKHECDPDPQLCDTIPIFESILTLVLLLKLDPFFEPTLISVSIDFKIEQSLLDSHISLMGKECDLVEWLTWVQEW